MRLEQDITDTAQVSQVVGAWSKGVRVEHAWAGTMAPIRHCAAPRGVTWLVPEAWVDFEMGSSITLHWNFNLLKFRRCTERRNRATQNR